MSEEKRKILEHLIEYLQQKIDSGEHKIFYNDLMYDEKTIDCINAINNSLEEIERLNNIIKEVREYIETEYLLEFKDDFEKPFILTDKNDWNKLLEILDKGSDEISK